MRCKDSNLHHHCIIVYSFKMIEVDSKLVKSKCIPILLYGLEVCELNKSQMASLDFTINRFL